MTSLQDTLLNIETKAQEFISSNAFTLIYNDKDITFSLYAICSINRYSGVDWFIIKDPGIFLNSVGLKDVKSVITFIKSWTEGNKLVFENYRVITRQASIKPVVELSVTLPNKTPLLSTT